MTTHRRMTPGEVFTGERIIAVADTDMAGIAHFTAYLRWVEEAEVAFYRAAGTSLCGREADGTLLGWPRVSVAAEYLGPVHFEDVVLVSVSIVRDGRSSREWRFSIVRKRDGAEVARGTMKTVRAAIDRDGRISSRAIRPAI